MKNFIFIILSSWMLISCLNDSDNNFKSEGRITGIDLRLCACCGGYFIEIEDVVYNFPDEFPNKESLDLENLPLKVKLDWELKPGGCDNFITISAIEPLY